MTKGRRKAFKMMYGLDSRDNIKQWQVIAIQRADGTAELIREHGKLGGKIQNQPKPIKGKNIGRSNETTPFEQACAEAKSLMQSKWDEGYRYEEPDPNNPPDIFLPMKCHQYMKNLHKVIFPCAVQIKYNGMRCLPRKEEQKPSRVHVRDDWKYMHTDPGERIMFHSSGNQLYQVLERHMGPPLMEMLDLMDAPDGEVYKHGWPLGRIVSRATKRYKSTKKLQLLVYDRAPYTAECKKDTFEKRWAWVENTIPPNHPIIVRAPTYIVDSHKDIDRLYSRFIKAGYEGAIIRNLRGIYRFNFRSSDIFKRPEYLRKEFKIIGGKEGTGVDAGCVIFECLVKKGVTFEVRPQGSVAARQQMFRDLPNLIGKPLTVCFKEWTEHGKPHCGVGEAIRDYE